MPLLQSGHLLFPSPLLLFTCCFPNHPAARSQGLGLSLRYFTAPVRPDPSITSLTSHRIGQDSKRNSKQSPLSSVKVRENALLVLPAQPAWLFRSCLTTREKGNLSCCSDPWILYSWLITAGHTEQLRTKDVTRFPPTAHVPTPRLSAAIPTERSAQQLLLQGQDQLLAWGQSRPQTSCWLCTPPFTAKGSPLLWWL